VLKDVMTCLDAAVCAEIALLIFLGVFLAVTVRTLLGNPRASQAQAAIPLSDGLENSRS
jgi:hypothetical protein